jgi:hypothetical protein
MARRVSTAVAFIVFNRPDTTARVFTEIAKAQPRKLLVVADGPRPDRPGEQEKCALTRSVIERVNWDCEVLTNFSDVNLGCKRRVSSGIDWVFEQVEEAIILEDDCLPHESFFRFCDELLDRYRDDSRIMAISGDNFQIGRPKRPNSYYYSRYTHIWGWATWRRAWQLYDVTMSRWPVMRNSGWLERFGDNRASAQYWTDIFDTVHSGKIDTWDYQWVFACWAQNGFTVLPAVNLVSNIGFHGDATHTKGSSIYANIEAREMIFPLQHPVDVSRDTESDTYTQQTMFAPPPVWRRVARKAYRALTGK